MKTRVVELDPKAFSALMVTCRLLTDWEGAPEITPVFVLSVNPEGSEPDRIEKTIDSPVKEGVIEKEALLGMVYADWG